MERRFGEWLFSLVGKILPERDERSEVVAEEYAAEGNLELHKHGHGPFCRFQIAQETRWQCGGVYILTEDGRPLYVGESGDLKRVWGTNGFGRITPANRAKGSRSTMCRINNGIFRESQKGAEFCLWFHPVEGGNTERKKVKDDLVAELIPPWN